MSTELSRRTFLGAAGAAMVAAGAATRVRASMARQLPVVIASGNGLRAAERAHEMLKGEGVDPLDAVVDGVRIIEDDPEDMTVGLGGLPNEEGIVELDASVMHGPTHRSGAVAALRNIRNAASVAREVARRTDHCLLVGEGALKFARRLGFQEENLLTEKAREAWLRWRAALSDDDDWLIEQEYDLPTPPPERQAMSTPVPFTTGTVHCSAISLSGDLAGTTTTSGLSWKLPGRVGDSPIIGAGLYVDNEVGAAGATGRGEAALQSCAAHAVVERMRAGDEPTAACLAVIQQIDLKTRQRRLRTPNGKPRFNLSLYALRKDGIFGGMSLISGGTMAVVDEGGARIEKLGNLYVTRDRD